MQAAAGRMLYDTSDMDRGGPGGSMLSTSLGRGGSGGSSGMQMRGKKL